ncbi:MAG: TIGR02646 family protein [Deltaproteobacteria bacterium]|nr:TIGR02646 family protein [Deltaproteobacteria bacterium]
MIKIVRSPKPKVLERHEIAWTNVLLDASTEEGKKRAEKKYQHREIKDALLVMFHDKCAYCESKISHIAYEQIEHFRPKSKFPELTFEWTNLLLSCPICNGLAYKGDHFPEETEGGPLINPCEDMPDEHLDFVFDLDARLATVVGKTARGETTKKLLGLNRDDLRAYRTKVIMRFSVLASYAKTDPEAKRLLDEARKDDCEYAAFVRSLPTGDIGG